MNDKERQAQWQESATRIAETAQRAHQFNLINESKRRENAPMESHVSGDYSPKAKPPPYEGAKIVAYVILKKCRASLMDGCWSFEAGQKIDDLSVAEELRRGEIPMIPVYDDAPKEK
jgi:hypothetical protein